MKLLHSAILSLAAFAFTHGVNAEDFEFKLPISQQSSGSYHIAGSLGDDSELDFLVDTGAGMVILAESTFESIASLAGKKPSRRIAVRLADGRQNAVNVYTIEKLVLGEACNVGPLEVAVIPGAKHNILGMDVLNKAAPFAIYNSPPALALSTCAQATTTYASTEADIAETTLLQVASENTTGLLD